MQKYVKNITDQIQTIAGLELPANSYTQLAPTDWAKWATDFDIVSGISNDLIRGAHTDDGTADIDDPSESLIFFRSLVPPTQATQPYPFAQKKTPKGEKLFKRATGVSGGNIPAQTSADIIWANPYTKAKLTGIQVVKGQEGDQIDLYVLDSVTGTYTTQANFVLDQFGFGVYVDQGKSDHKSEYDATIYQGMQIKIVYHNNDDIKTAKPKFNLDLHEVKL